MTPDDAGFMGQPPDGVYTYGYVGRTRLDA
jgi:hypothetical protein